MDRPFIRGLQLSELFYQDAVKPIMDAHWSALAYSAARLDYGSDVLGFDTPQSMDHEWGPRLTLFLTEVDHKSYREEILQLLSVKLPYEIHNYPTNFGLNKDGTRAMQEIASGPVNHYVELDTVRSFFGAYLNYDPRGQLSIVDWLSFPEQRLRTIASGRVFHDGLRELKSIQDKLHYYPRDLWLYLLAAQWRRISQEEAFVGRCGDVGDELGSRLVAARLVGELIKLCFLMERQYAPYSKWFGTAFSQLASADNLGPILNQVLDSDTWQEREKALSLAYEHLARMHNDLKITQALPSRVSHYHGRPYRVIHADRFTDAIRNVIISQEVKRLPAHLGAVDQFVDSTDMLERPDRIDKLKVLYEDGESV